jgi:hypothetical protein
MQHSTFLPPRNGDFKGTGEVGILEGEPNEPKLSHDIDPKELRLLVDADRNISAPEPGDNGAVGDDAPTA